MHNMAQSAPHKYNGKELLSHTNFAWQFGHSPSRRHKYHVQNRDLSRHLNS